MKNKVEEIVDIINERLNGKKIMGTFNHYTQVYEEGKGYRQVVDGTFTKEITYNDMADCIFRGYIVWQDMVDDYDKYVNDMIDHYIKTYQVIEAQ